MRNTVVHSGPGVLINREFLSKVLPHWSSYVQIFAMNGGDPSLLEKAASEAGLKFGENVIFSDSSDISAIAVENKADALNVFNMRDFMRTADIDDVPSAEVIKNLSFAEATELSYYGAPIVKPSLISGAVESGIPVFLRYSEDPLNEGTIVAKRSDMDVNRPVKGFSAIRHATLINVEGPGMSGVPGIAGRLFAALSKDGISVVLISQGSSESSICFAVRSDEAGLALKAATETFIQEITEGLISRIECDKGNSIIAAVGEEMPGTPGIAAKIFSALAAAHVNIRAIAQGSSERNISVVIDESETTKALRALHGACFLSPSALSLGVFGIGNIGGTFIDQVRDQGKNLLDQFGVDLRVRAIANSKRMLLCDSGLDLSNWREKFAAESVPLDVERLVSFVNASYFPHSLIVDCTASGDLPAMYCDWLEKGINIVTPNKKAGTSPYHYYRKMLSTCEKTGSRWLYEATVGAGLPVICTLKDLVRTGDKVTGIEGLLSGTLAWLFSAYDGTIPFSQLVLKAKELGYTEPDPRDDLSGMDVARKTVIMARELGYPAEVDNIEIQSLIPEELVDVSKEDFLSKISVMDDGIKALYEEAKARGEVLRYVGTVDSDGKCSVALRSYGPDNPFAASKGTDSVIVFSTSRYSGNQPLVIKGPGAGPSVTAGGVFADLLRLCSYLGAKL